MEKTRKLEDIQCSVQQIQTKLSKLEEERKQFHSLLEKVWNSLDELKKDR